MKKHQPRDGAVGKSKGELSLNPEGINKINDDDDDDNRDTQCSPLASTLTYRGACTHMHMCTHTCLKRLSTAQVTD